MMLLLLTCILVVIALYITKSRVDARKMQPEPVRVYRRRSRRR